MNKKKIIIIVIYLISLLMFSIIADLTTDKFIQWYMETMDYGNMLLAMVPSLLAEFLHIFATGIIAIALKINNKMDIDIRRLFYIFPIVTIFLWIPITLISSQIVF